MHPPSSGATSAPAGTQLVEVLVTESLDAQAIARLESLLDEALAMRPTHLVVDLSNCPFADAAAIGTLVEAHRRAWQAGGRLTLRSPSARLRRILELSRVDHVLHVIPDLPSGSGW